MSTEKPRFDNLQDWLKWQEGLHFTSIELGLDRCKAVANKLDLLSPTFKVISVAGTNGKGSSVTMLDNILSEAGYKTGSYMSPHLIRYNERIRVAGIEIDDDTLCDSFSRIDAARGKISLTFFEFGTLAALDIFRNEQIDIAILEVGLGGRLDAVNILDADVALVTSIALDHEFWLGKNRESIAREKAGIFRHKKPAACSDPNPPHTLIEYADSIGADLNLLGRDFQFEFTEDSWDWKTQLIEYKNLPKPCAYNRSQMANASGVLMALSCLPENFEISDTAIHEGLKQFQLNGRFQRITGDTEIILDVAHNQQAARIFAENLNRLNCAGDTHVVIGMLSDKDHTAVFAELDDIASSWRIVELDSPRATETSILLEELEKLENKKPVSTFSTMSAALDDVLTKVKKTDRIVITGSFLTVGAAINELNFD